jgi:hypothetical protein
MIDQISKKEPRYGMRPRKYKYSNDFNKPTAEKDQELNHEGKVHVLIKQKN